MYVRDNAQTLHVHAHTHVYTHTHKHMHTHTHTHMHARMYAHMHTQAHIHAHTHTRTHTLFAFVLLCLMYLLLLKYYCLFTNLSGDGKQWGRQAGTERRGSGKAVVEEELTSKYSYLCQVFWVRVGSEILKYLFLVSTHGWPFLDCYSRPKCMFRIGEEEKNQLFELFMFQFIIITLI